MNAVPIGHEAIMAAIEAASNAPAHKLYAERHAGRVRPARTLAKPFSTPHPTSASHNPSPSLATVGGGSDSWKK